MTNKEDGTGGRRMNLIDKDALLRKKKYPFKTGDGAFSKTDYFMKLSDILNASVIDPLPDITEVNCLRQTGEWVDGTQGFYCSKCNEIDINHYEHNYCPFCGVRMT